MWKENKCLSVHLISIEYCLHVFRTHTLTLPWLSVSHVISPIAMRLVPSLTLRLRLNRPNDFGMNVTLTSFDSMSLSSDDSRSVLTWPTLKRLSPILREDLKEVFEERIGLRVFILGTLDTLPSATTLGTLIFFLALFLTLFLTLFLALFLALF